MTDNDTPFEKYIARELGRSEFSRVTPMYRRELVGRVRVAAKSLRSRAPNEESRLENELEFANDLHDEAERAVAKRNLLVWRAGGEDNFDVIGASGLLTVRRDEWMKSDYLYKIVCDRLFDMPLEKANNLLPEEIDHLLGKEPIIERISFFKRVGQRIPGVWSRKYWIMHAGCEYELPTREKCIMDDVSGMAAVFLSEIARYGFK